MPPEVRPSSASAAADVDAVLDRVIRRIWMADAARAAAFAALSGAVVSTLLLARGTTAAAPAALLVGAMVFGIALWRGKDGRSPRAAAARIEARHPEFRNLVVTAEELRTHPARASAWMRERVIIDAASRLRAAPAAAVVPIAKPLALCAAAAAVWIAVVLGLPTRAATTIADITNRLTGTPAAAAGQPRVVAELRAPQYTNVAVREIVDPERLEAIGGTVLRLRVGAADDGWRVRFGTTVLAVRRVGRELVAETTLSESGYFAIEPVAAAPSAAATDPRRMLIPVIVTPDRAPTIRIDAPGRDLLLPSSATQVPVSASAADDFALQALEIRYTKVSGSGEQFEFEEGTLPLALTRSSERAWKGSARLAIDALKMEPGDTLVYRAVGRDRRPGEAGLASSDTFFVEIQGPGQVALEGIEMPPAEERYALSQQMVVLKIERLRARERAMPGAELEEAAASIAAEQRSVRANFIFLMGGHVEDEFEEAEQSHEIQEGRLENNARKSIAEAIHQMTLAEQGLTAIDTARALPPAKAAVEALQRAFGRNRYILRTLASRSRVDPSRRLSGELEEASDWRRDLSAAALDRVTRDARALLVEALEIAATLRADGDVAPTRIGALAEQALRIDPGSAQWQSASALLMRVRDAIVEQRPAADVADRLNAAIAPIVAVAQKEARDPRGAGSVPAGTLQRAWAEEVRK